VRRALGIAISASVLAALGAGVANAAAIAPDPQQVILRLIDLGPGYRFGNDDSGCPAKHGDVEYGVTGTADRVSSCTNQLVDRRQASATPPRARTVDSGAYVFETGAAAVANFDDHRLLLANTNALPSDQAVAGPPAIGDETAMYRGPHGWDGPTTSLVWRTGRVISFVAVAAPNEPAATSGAIGLARLQQERVLAPTPIGPHDNSETWSFLNDPRLGFDVYWLGETFDPAGPLPKRSLLDADHWGGFGWRARVMYGGAIDLGLWKPSSWVRFKHSKLGRHFFCGRCVKQRSPRLAGRRAAIFSTRVECLPGKLPAESIAIDGPPKPCRSRRPNLFMAAVRVRDTVVSVNVPVCFTCGNTARDPYNSVRGMRAIAAALEARVPDR